MHSPVWEGDEHERLGLLGQQPEHPEGTSDGSSKHGGCHRACDPAMACRIGDRGVSARQWPKRTARNPYVLTWRSSILIPCVGKVLLIAPPHYQTLLAKKLQRAYAVALSSH